MQTYVGYELPGAFGPNTELGLQTGRFTLNLGSRRLVAADDYRNTTNGNTGVRADVALTGNLPAAAIYTLPQVRLPDGRADLVDSRVKFDRENFDLVLWGRETHLDEQPERMIRRIDTCIMQLFLDALRALG